MGKCGMLIGKVNLARALEQLRGNRSRVEFATMAGISPRTIEDIESGKSPNPTIGTLLALCGAAGKSPIEFLKDAYPDLHRTETIVKKDPNDVSLKSLIRLIEGFAHASDARKALALLLLAHTIGDHAKHFREYGLNVSMPAATKLKLLLGEIEKLIRDDQAQRV